MSSDELSEFKGLNINIKYKRGQDTIKVPKRWVESTSGIIWKRGRKKLGSSKFGAYKFTNVTRWDHDH